MVISMAATGALPDQDNMVERIGRRDLRTVSRCISWIENGHPEARRLLSALAGSTGQPLVIGVTGVPGAGKSTIVPALARRFAEEKAVAVLAVDPSSPLTGGAILGDRIRDPELGQTGIFFRSIASRGSLGGLSHTLDDIVTLLDAARFDAILIETVGTGQSEIAVTRLAHTTLMLTAPGLGDEVQAMKAGILEVADLIVVNKADLDPRGADATSMTLRQTISDSVRAHGLSEGSNAGGDGRDAIWLPPVRAVSALAGKGLDEISSLMEAHRTFLEQEGGLERWRRARVRNRFGEAMRARLVEMAMEKYGADYGRLVVAVEDGRMSPFDAAAEFAASALSAHLTNGQHERKA